jgi:type VI secretion system protein ImpK
MEPQVSSTVTMQAGRAPEGRLALVVQEALTAVVRLREGRQVPSDAVAFRTRMKDLLANADQDARRMGYPPEFVKVAVYCVIAYLDETVMGTAGPLASAWVGQPLQEEVFGDHVAGETFFRHLEDLLSRQDSPFVADALEVPLLCMLLGFKGRYGSSDGSELRSFIQATEEKITRIRGGRAFLAPHALPPQDEGIVRGIDPWLRRLSLGLLGSAIAVFLLFVFLRFFSLPGGVARIREITG